jgi:hypothetical protein
VSVSGGFVLWCLPAPAPTPNKLTHANKQNFSTKLIIFRWMIREPSMLAAFDEGLRSFTGGGCVIDHCFAQVAKLSDTMTLQHIPRRNYNNYFKPSKIIDTLRQTFTHVIASALVAYFNGGAPYGGMNGILKVIYDNMEGAGIDYGGPLGV